ncbi:hypothetical protein AB0C51_02535 [Streptomyces pathocidini]|uniref:tetratricopeptide repeat protein n=1 Tax=Streptomyces pathocidini TaxID=1650571 RepID=UPI0033CF0181
MPARRLPNQALRSLLAEAGWTQESLARNVNLLGRETGVHLEYDRTSVSHWLAGVRPRPESVALIEEALSRRLSRPVTAAMLGLAPDPSVPDPAAAARGCGCAAHRLAEVSSAELDPARTRALRHIPFRLADTEHVGIPWGARQPCGNGEERVGRSHVLLLDSAVSAFAPFVDCLGGEQGRRALATLLAESVSAWLRAPCAPAVRDGLLINTARLTLLISRMHTDIRAQGLAQRYLRLSLRLAAEANDRATTAIALRLMSTQAHDLGHRRAALRLAEQAVRIGGTAPASVQAFALAQLAVAQAHDGDRARALASLHDAEQLATTAESTPGPFGSYPLSAFAYQQAMALRGLGDQRAAVRALETSLSLRPGRELRSRALTQAQLATALLSLGQIDAACAAWQKFLDDYPLIQSGTADGLLGKLRRDLRPHRRSPAAGLVLRRAGVGPYRAG